MNLPFTTEQFLDVFSNYNTSVWPAQIIFYLFAIICTVFIVKKVKINIILPFLSFLWIWMGIVYHLIYFSPINKAAYFFAILFIIQGIYFLFLYFKRKVEFKIENDVYGYTGFFLVIFSLFIYPVLNFIAGHNYPASPTFGLPCPTTIFTFGIFLWARQIPGPIFIIPVLWSIVGFSAAFALGITEDISLIIAAILSVALLLIKRKHQLPASSDLV